MTTPDHRICFVGDSFVHGTGDAEGIGWVGRLAANAREDGHDLTAYNLGVRRDSSAEIAARWQAECEARFRVACTPGVVFSFGSNDMTALEKQLQVPIPESVEHFSNVIAVSKKHYRTLVIGPLPTGNHDQDVRITALCATYALRAADIGVPYLPLAESLLADPQWRRAVAAGDGVHPGADGYALLAGRIRRWPAWWFSSTPAA